MRIAAALVAAFMLTGCSGPGATPPGAPMTHPEALLRAAPFPDLTIDVDYMAGAEPLQESLESGLAALRQVIDKRSATVEPATQIAGGPQEYGFGDLLDVAMASRDVVGPPFGSDGTARLHLVYARGSYAGGGNETVAGFYERLTGTVFIFVDSWRSNPDMVFAVAATGISPSVLEAEVLTHELGHALGLVNIGTPMLTDRVAAGDACACHSANVDSVMTPGVHDPLQHLQHILGRRGLEPTGFDADDLADLAAFREGRTGPPMRSPPTSPSSP